MKGGFTSRDGLTIDQRERTGDLACVRRSVDNVSTFTQGGKLVLFHQDFCADLFESDFVVDFVHDTFSRLWCSNGYTFKAPTE
jgi:hypothetical protein